MTSKPILIVAGEPNSIFFEIFLKTLKKKEIRSIKNPIIIICNKNLLLVHMKKIKIKFKINEIYKDNFHYEKLNNNQVNIINVSCVYNKPFGKITSKSNKYIEECIDLALRLIKIYKFKTLINGPISKTHFLKKKFPGMTEYFAQKVSKVGNEVMLIYNNSLSVSPLTTHLPVRKIFKKITKKNIINHVKIIENFYKKFLKKKPYIGITGLNPHCETTDQFSEDKMIIDPAVRKLRKKGFNIQGPVAADTIFLKNNIKHFDVIIGMFHDQVLTPIKTLYGFDAINITLGLPFIRITPDHGTNNKMIGKNLSNPTSLIKAIQFAKKFS